MKTQKPLKSEMTEKNLIEQFSKMGRHKGGFNEQILLAKPKGQTMQKMGTKVNI